MSNPVICNCPFTDWCHEIRQKLQVSFRLEDLSYKETDCTFYKMIKEKENENDSK